MLYLQPVSKFDIVRNNLRMIQKIIILTSILISFGLQAQSKCQLLPLYDQEKFEFEDRLYTPFWAQEYVGVDLVKEEMASI